MECVARATPQRALAILITTAVPERRPMRRVGSGTTLKRPSRDHVSNKIVVLFVQKNPPHTSLPTPQHPFRIPSPHTLTPYPVPYTSNPIPLNPKRCTLYLQSYIPYPIPCT